MKATKTASGSWRVLAYSNGHRKSFTHPDKKMAMLMATEWVNGKKEDAKLCNRTVGMAADEYIAGRTNILSPATISGYRKIAEKYLDPYRDMKVSAITKEIAQSIINELSAKYSPKTVRNIWAFFRSCCDLEYKPALPRKKKLVYKTPSPQGIKDILNVTKNTPVEVPVLLALWCGLRMSEVRGLRWSRVFPDHIVIDTAIVDVDGEPITKEPKTESSVRSIPINKWLYDKIQSEPHTTEFITNLSGNAIYWRFQRLTGKACRFHDLRHANASLLTYLNIDSQIIMERNGWASDHIMRDVYIQTYEEGRADATAKIDDFFMQTVQETVHKEDNSQYMPYN